MRRDVTRCCEQLREEQYASVEQLRVQTACALEDRLARWWAASETNPKAMELVIKLLEARARLFGLYSADRLEQLDPLAPPPKVQIEFVRTGYFDDHPDEKFNPPPGTRVLDPLEEAQRKKPS